MASKKIALVLQRKFGRLATVLIYAVLEWVLILLLLINGLLSFFTTKFAQFFGLHPPCLWCSRLDHLLGNEDPNFYRKLICDLHAKEISSLGYCHSHKKLSDVNGMCEDCLLSFANENKSNSCTYKSLVGKLSVDLEYSAENEPDIHLGSQMGNHSDQNEHEIRVGFQMSNLRGTIERDFHLMGDHSEENKHDVHVRSETANCIPMEKPLQESSSVYLTDGVCSCCKSPLKSRLFSHRFVQTKLIDGQQKDAIHMPSVNAVVDFAEDVDREEALKKSIGYPEAILHECRIRSIRSEEKLAEAEAEDMELGSLDHIGYTELKVTSDSGSEVSISDVDDVSEIIAEDTANEERDNGQCLQRTESPVKVISESLMKGMVDDLISDVANSCSDEIIVEGKVEIHENGSSEGFSERLVERIDPKTLPEELGGEDPVTAKAKLETRFEADKIPHSDNMMPIFETPALVADGRGPFSDKNQVERQCAQLDAMLPHETLDLVHSEEILIAMDETMNKEISVEGSSSETGVILDYGLAELEWTNISDYGHPSPVSPFDLKGTSAEIVHAECTTTPKDVLEVNQGTEVLKPGLPMEVKGTSSGTSPFDDTPPPEDVLEATDEVSGTQGSKEIEATDREDEPRSMDVDIFGDEEEMNKPQKEDRILPEYSSGHGLDQPDAQNGCGVPGGLSVADDYRSPETQSSIEGLHMLHKRLGIERNDSGLESLDGSILSEIEGESAVDRLKRQLELERKSLHALYSELEAERSASAVAANQAMAMITRLQEEKAAMQMEALQYQRMMEEQSEYDQEALQLMNEIVVKREKEMKDLEKEVELYRKRFHHEATDKRKDKRRKTTGEEIDTHFERKGDAHDKMPNDQYQKVKTSSISSLSEDTDECSSTSGHEVEEDFDLQQSNQNTPAELTLSASGGYEDQKLDSSLDESLVDFEEERLSILERLKSLEEKLHTLADDGESESGKPQNETSAITMVHPEANIEPDEYSEVVFRETEPSGRGIGEDSSIQEKPNGNDYYLPVQDGVEVHDDLKQTCQGKDSQGKMNTGKSDPATIGKLPITSRAGGVKAKRLLPLFEATSLDDATSYQMEGPYRADQSNDWRTVSMIARDNGRLAIEEEVDHLNERLQALEADREFLKHTIKSLTKGDEGMKLLQEIAQHLRELRRIEMRGSNFNDSFMQQNPFLSPSSKGNGTMMMQPHF